MKKTPYSRVEVLMLLAVTLIVAALAALGMRAYQNRDNRWVRIVSPTGEKAVEIMAVTRLLQPYVRTQEGAFYFCTGSAWNDTCTQVDAAQLPVNKVPVRWLSCQPELPPLPPLPGAIVHTLEVAQCQEGRTYSKLVILDDGTIWQWKRTFSWVSGFALGSVIVYGILFGVLLGILAVHLRRAFRAPIPPLKTDPKSGGR